MKILDLSAGDRDFLAEVESRSGQNLKTCYQCGNCTAGCPYTFAYDIPVSQVMRLIQAGQREMVLNSKSLWLCASCQSCTTRCPNEIDVAKVMDVCRHMARESGCVSERTTKLFTDAFLQSVETHGRAYELGLMARYTLKSGRFFDNIALGPTALLHNKLSFKPHPIQGKEQVARIFERFRKGE
ncbi:MAG: 4Fe-4S dicluster domain-containing protein [Desulfobulbus sp.]|jgi:heterodisulfide reductase subunit C|nr:4Fe-4S dicluster domain-containing protein [Desulfobulbaceae bacterium]